MNVTEDKDNFYVRAELPGIKPDDLEISVTGNSLSITGERTLPAEEANAKYHRRERDAGKFNRIITMPSDIDPEKVQANSADGVLTIVLREVAQAGVSVMRDPYVVTNPTKSHNSPPRSARDR